MVNYCIGYQPFSILYLPIIFYVQPFGIWLLRIISPLSRTGKYRRKQLSHPLPINRIWGTAFLFYSYAIFSARKELSAENYLLSLILDSCDLIRLLRGCRKAKTYKEAFLWVTLYPIKVHLVSVLSTKVAVLGKKMRYLFLSFLLYSSTVDMR